MNLAERIELIKSIKAKRAELNQEVAALTEKLESEGAALISAIKGQGLTSIKIDGTSATISTTDYGNIKDFDAFGKYIIENDALYLLQRRLTQPSILELMKAEGEIPGIEFFKKETISLRNK